jgi:hypothetical protein
MSPRGKRRRPPRKKRVIARGIAAGGTVTLAALGLTNCDEGGSVDPLPPPIVCADADQGQTLVAFGTVQDTSLTVHLGFTEPTPIDTLYVTDATGATLDSLDVGVVTLYFTLESDTTSQVTFTLAGTFDLEGGPCDFTRVFTVTIDNGNVDVAHQRVDVPLQLDRDVRIELVERDGLRVRLEARGVGERAARWRVTAGTLERVDAAGAVWQLPSRPGFYQVELVVERGDRGVGFDALSLEVS